MMIPPDDEAIKEFGVTRVIFVPHVFILDDLLIVFFA